MSVDNATTSSSTQVLVFPTELVPAFLTELVLSVLIFLFALVLSVLAFLTEPVLSVLLFLIALVLSVLAFLT
jgi:hypothetical protein